MALGNKAKAYTTRSIAIGENAVAGVVGGDFADGASYYGIAIGQDSTVKGRAGIAIGRQANTSGEDALAIGRESIAAANGTAIGAGAKANKAGGVAIGAGSIANIEAGIKGFDPSTGGATTKTSNVWQSTRAAVALGDSDNGVTRQLTGLAAGTNDSDAVNVAQLRATNDRVTTNTGDIADINAGRTGIVRQDAGTGAITVGAQTGGTSVDFSNSANEARQLTGIASAGDITDVNNANNVVNAGDVNTAVGNLTEAGLNFQGDDGTLIDRNLGDTLTITGGETDSNNLTADNIGVVANGTGGLSVQLAKNIAVDSVTTGNTVTNSDGVKVDDGLGNATTITTAGTTVTDGTNSSDYSAAGSTITNGNTVTTVGAGNISVSGIDNTDPSVTNNIVLDGTTGQISGVADATAADQAINKGQLDAIASAGDAKTDALGNSTASNLGGGANYDAATGVVSAPSYELDNGNTTVNNVGSALENLDGRTTTNTDNIADINAGRTGIVRQDAGTGAITVGAQTGGTSVDFTNDDNTDRQLTGVASAGDITVAGNANNAVNAGDVNTAVTGLANAGLKFSGDNNTATPFTRKLGEELKVRGGATDLTDNNIGVVASAEDTLTVKLAENIDLGATGSVTTGNTITNTNGVAITDGIAGGATNTMTAAGTTVTDGVVGGNTSNYGAEGITATDGTNSTTVGTGRISISGVDNTDPLNPVSNTLVLDGNTGQISGVADATAADQAINKGQLDAIASAGDAKTDALGNSTASNLGGGANYDAATGVVSAPSYELDNGNTTVNNVGSALENLDGRTTTNTDNIADINAGRTGIVRQDAGTGAITVGAQTGGTSVDFTNSAGDACTLTGVAAGTDATDAVNKAQLDAITGNITAAGVQYDRNTDDTVNYDQVSFAGTPAVIEQNDSGNNIVVSGGTTLRNVANGITASDAVNKGQLDSATKVKVVDGNGNEIVVNVADQVVNKGVINPDNPNRDSLFLTYDVSGQEVTDRLTIGQTVQKMNTEGVKFAHTNARDNGAGSVGMTNDSSAGGFDSTAIGVNAIIKEGADSTVALGHDTEATETAKDSVVIGKGSKVSGASSVAIGDNAQANGAQSISIGTGNIVNGDNSGAFGDPSTINGNNSYSVGNNNTINSDDTFVIGNGITANQNGSVVLGLGSAATTGAGIAGFGANSNAAIAATTSTTGAVAVGDAANGVYRQVTGVAAGTADSDAVNVSQLKAVSDALGDSNASLNNAAVQYDKNPDDSVNKGSITLGGGARGTTITNVANGVQASDAVNKGQLDNLGSGVAGIIGGDASYDAGGNLTANNIGGTGQGNISDAIAAVNQGNAQANEDIQANNEQITDNTGRLDAGISFGADNGDNISQSVGGNNGSIQFEGGNNITTSTANGSIQIGLDGNIEVDSVTTGNTVVNDNGVTIQDGPSMTTEGFNAANTVITGVGAGNIAADSTDAINGSQLHALDKKLGDSVNALGYRIGEVEDNANAGISAAMAMSSLPQAYIPGKSMVGGGIASYNGESAVAVGVSKVSDNGRWVIKVNGTADTQGNAGGAIGAGFHF
ncbi:hypothetical protein BTV98_01650 [Psychrobacter sp. Cmf 22.2]|nr:YadA-like family protein [Psychrobacter sp. Cmf 22.2]OLF39142.1 hypothetical protein BTV98_01650 [Psychrobacter sp. Cmf 22.2]